MAGQHYWLMVNQMQLYQQTPQARLRLARIRDVFDSLSPEGKSYIEEWAKQIVDIMKVRGSRQFAQEGAIELILLMLFPQRAGVAYTPIAERQK